MTTTHDTAAALWSAIDAYGCDAASNGALGKDATTRAAIDRAITAHVEAEVARRLAAAPDVEAAIDRLDMYADPYRADALRAAIAADKARAVEAEATRRDAEIFGLRARLAIVAEIAEEAISSAPTPDEARRLVDDLESRAVIAAGYMADYDESELDAARTALLRALGVES